MSKCSTPSSAELCLHRRPSLGHVAKGLLLLRPVIQGGWIEIGAVRPDKRLRLGIDSDLIERCHVAKWFRHMIDFEPVLHVSWICSISGTQTPDNPYYSPY